MGMTIMVPGKLVPGDTVAITLKKDLVFPSPVQYVDFPDQQQLLWYTVTVEIDHKCTTGIMILPVPISIVATDDVLDNLTEATLQRGEY